MTIAITIERYVSVCRPTSEFKAKCFLIPLPTILAILYNIPKFFEIETVHKIDEQVLFINESDEKIKVEDIGYRGTPLRLNYWYIILYVTWSKLLLVEIIPWITVIVLNVFIWKKIKKFRATRISVFHKHEGMLCKLKLNHSFR